MINQTEQLLQTIIEKNKEIARLKQVTAPDPTPNPIEKSLWKLLFVVCDKYIKCPKCYGRTKPSSLKTGVVLVKCKRCGHIFLEKENKGRTFNAYYDNAKRSLT